MTANPPPPGWYPDPDGKNVLRYWDGEQWTHHRQGAAAKKAAEDSVIQRHPALLTVGVLAAIVLIIAVIANGGSSGRGSSPSSSGGPTLDDTKSAELLSITSAPKWGEFTAKCTETPIALAGEVQAGYEDLQRHSLTETYPALIQHLNHSIPTSIAPTQCADVIAAYLVLREPG